MDDPTSAAALHLAALVESSDDAIISKDLNGIVTSWNRAAERVFGYTASETIGRSIATVIPFDRLSEETEVLTRIRRGESVDHFETIRRHKDGALDPHLSHHLAHPGAGRHDRRGVEDCARHFRTAPRRGSGAAAEARQDDLRRRLMALVAGSGALFESPRLEDVLPAIVALARSLTRADGYAIWRLNAVDGIWEIGASWGVSDGFARAILLSQGRRPGRFRSPNRSSPKTSAHIRSCRTGRKSIAPKASSRCSRCR